MDEAEGVFTYKQDTLILFREEKDENAQFMKVYEEAANALQGQIIFSYANITGGIQERIADFAGIKSDDLPILMAFDVKDMKKYASSIKPQDLNTEKIKNFIEEFKTGEMKQFLKSEAVPEKNDGPVTIIVGKTFEKIAKDPTKDVLVKFYAPWCGHCKRLAPTWEELGEHFKDNKDLLIAKFDATANEVDGLEIQGYPTLVFFPKDNKDGISYDGGRGVEDFKKWLAEKSPVLGGSSKKTEL
jgi:protein disulfide-isomerase A1